MKARTMTGAPSPTPHARPSPPPRPKAASSGSGCLTCSTALDHDVLQLKPGVLIHRRCFVCFACSTPLALGAYADLPSANHPGHYLCPLHASRATTAGTRTGSSRTIVGNATEGLRRGTAAPRLDIERTLPTALAPPQVPVPTQVSGGPGEALALPHISPRRSVSLDSRGADELPVPRGRTATALPPNGIISGIPPPMQISGFLLRSTGQNMRRWKKMYCVCVAGSLQFRSSPEDKASTDEVSLAAASVVRENDVAGAKGPCFSLLTSKRIYTLQSESEAELQRWLQALRSGAGSGANGTGIQEVRTEGYVRMQVPAHGFLFDTGAATATVTGGLMGKASKEHAWAWRWLQVKEGYVYLYKFKEDKKLVDAIDLLMCAVSETRVEGKEHTFELTLGKDENYVVQTESAVEQSEWLRALRYHISQLRKDVERQVAAPSLTSASATGQAERKGWLQKRGDGGVLRSWHRRWCVVRGEAMYWHKDDKDAQAQGSASVLFAMPRETKGKDRRFLELVTAERTYEFQASTLEEGQAWLSALRAVQQRLMNNKLRQTLSARRMSVMPALLESHERGAGAARVDFRRLLDDVQARTGNNVCADCGDGEPQWASINLGIFICVQCAGGHRSLGVHLSQVRSVALDRWEADTVEFMAERGNQLANNEWEAQAAQAHARRPQAADSLETRERFIRDKYERRLFCAALATAPSDATLPPPMDMPAPPPPEP